MSVYWMCVFLYLCAKVCVSGAWVVTHSESDWELRPLAGRAWQVSAGLKSSSATQLSFSGGVGPSPRHAEEAFMRTPYWEASSMKNRTMSSCLIVSSHVGSTVGSDSQS